MSIVTIRDVTFLNNPAKFQDPYYFKVTFECIAPLKEDLEWRVIFVASPDREELDQELDDCMVGPVPPGVNAFDFEANPPNPASIPKEDVLGVAAVILTGLYKDQEFVRVGYYQNTEYDTEELNENPPAEIDFSRLRRELAAKPRVTRFNIKWDTDATPAPGTPSIPTASANASSSAPGAPLARDPGAYGGLSAASASVPAASISRVELLISWIALYYVLLSHRSIAVYFLQCCDTPLVHMCGGRTGLLNLPAELLFEILAHSASSQFPLVNKHLLHSFRYAPPSSRAYFILGRLDPSASLVPETVLDSALSYPMCNTSVLDYLERMHPLVLLPRSRLKAVRVSPGRWIFRNLQSQPKPRRRRKHGSSFTPAQPSHLDTHPRTNPLVFLESLANRYTLSFSAQGSAFALAMCVRAGPTQHPLLQVLLRNGADPSAKSCLPLQIAATLGDLNALKLMIEPSTEQQAQGATGRKRRRVEDRAQPTTKVLSAAVKEGHIEVAEWLMHEKGVVPDMATMRMLQHA